MKACTSVPYSYRYSVMLMIYNTAACVFDDLVILLTKYYDVLSSKPRL